MTIEERWSDNDGVRLHSLISIPENTSGLPLVYLPGALGSAEDGEPLLRAFDDRQSLAISLRGRGKSDAPNSGYRFADHVADCAAAVDAAGFPRFVLYGYSMSVPIAVAYASAHPDRVAGLILGDYPALYPPVSEEWAEHVIEGGTPEHVARGIQQDAELIVLWEKLKEADRHGIPTAILYGSRDGAMLGERGVEFYRNALTQPQMFPFKDSGHELWEPDFDRYVSCLHGILSNFDSRVTAEQIA